MLSANTLIGRYCSFLTRGVVENSSFLAKESESTSLVADVTLWGGRGGGGVSVTDVAFVCNSKERSNRCKEQGCETRSFLEPRWAFLPLERRWAAF